MRANIFAAIVVAVALAAASCSDGTTDTAPASSSSSTTSTSTTSTAAPTTTAAPTATATTTTATATTTTATIPDSTCPGSGALPDLAENHQLAGGDVNGDGQIDTIHSYTIGDTTIAGAWWIQVSFASGGGSSYQVTEFESTISGVRPHDGFDINGSGKQEFFVRVGMGASVLIYGLFEVIDCDIHRITRDGAPSILLAGASMTNMSGFECVDIDNNGANDFLITYSGTRLGDSDEFEVTAAQYGVLDGKMNLIVADGIGGNSNDPGFVKFSLPGCPGMEGL